ncbi:hypothetical protein H4R99_008257 [Coemansia sp. RSA 1722]|nr:hypothetical protein H4R99_008257 [Coemansia sp. RSA 1722]
MSFRFNFGVSEDGENVTCPTAPTATPAVDSNGSDAAMCIDQEAVADTNVAVAAPFETIPLHIPKVSSLMVDAIFYRGQRLWKRQIDDVQFQLAQQDSMDGGEDSAVRKAMAEDNHASDVIKGVYEGGLKTWECSIDLLSFLVDRQADLGAALRGMRVLEIGCGTGLPSLHILKTMPDTHVCMQDYNRDVLELVTMPNVLANTVLSPSAAGNGDTLHADSDTEACEIDIDFRRTQVLFGADTDDVIGKRDVPELTAGEANEADARMLQNCDIRNRCEFIAGDWASIEHELRRQGREHSFDLVLTSETIYDTDSYKSLHDLFACVLARPQAEINSLNQQVPAVLVAAKSIYFGLTGSVLTFKQYVDARGVFDVDSVWQSGGSMPREILRLTWK